MLRRTTHARTRTVSEYDTPYDGHAREDYFGEVCVDRRTFAQTAHAQTTFELGWDAVDVQVHVRSVMDVTVTGDGVEVAIETWARLNDAPVSHRTWREHLPVRPHPAG